MRSERRKHVRLSTELLLVATVVLGGLTGSCGFFGDNTEVNSPDCESRSYRIDNGAYATDSVRRQAANREQLPQRNLDEATIEVDRERGEVVVEYEKDGETVVETWRIEGG